MTWDGWCSAWSLQTTAATSSRKCAVVCAGRDPVAGIGRLSRSAPMLLPQSACTLSCTDRVFPFLHVWQGGFFSAACSAPTNPCWLQFALFPPFPHVLNCLCSSTACVELYCAFWVVLAIFLLQHHSRLLMHRRLCAEPQRHRCTHAALQEKWRESASHNDAAYVLTFSRRVVLRMQYMQDGCVL
jgi:hypothetical protein